MKKVKWGVISAGGIADRRTIPGLMIAKNAELAAVMDIDEEAAKRVAKKYDVDKAYTKERDLIKDPEVQAIYIASPANKHAKQVIAAAQAGKHLLCEKPLAMTVAQAKDVAKAVRKSGVKFAEGYMMRFNTLHQKAKKMVDDGVIGDVVFGRAQLSCWYPDMPGAWRQVPRLGGGGSLIDMACHCYDLLRMYMGEVKEVVAFCDTLTFKYKVEDSATTMLRFESGAHAVVDAFFNVPDAAGQDRLELYGNKGSIQAQGTIGQLPGGEMTAQLSPAGKDYDPQQDKASLDVKQKTLQAKPYNTYTAEIEALSKCILKDLPVEVNTLEDSIIVMKIIEAAYRSAKSGKVEKVK